MADKFLDVEAGNDSNTGADYANRVKTLTVGSGLLSPGDHLKLMASPAPNSLGVNGTFVRGSTKITLASAVTQLLYAGNSAGTASASVTRTTTTTRKSSTVYEQIAIGSGFTTGKAWYFDFGATDLSGYQQLSFWLWQPSGTLSSNLSFRICSDATGDVSVNTFTIPACSGTNQWQRVVIDLTSAMSASARSLALYVDSDQGAQTVNIGNVNACKAPGTGELHLKSFIGKAKSLGAGGDNSETWYPIRSIEGTTVTLDLANSSSAGSTLNGRYWGTSETSTAYSMVPCWVPVANATADNLFSAAGTSGSRITVSGGWNRTDMSTQTGITFIALPCASSATMSFYCSFVDFSDISIALYGTVAFSGTDNTFDVMHHLNGSVVWFGSCNTTVNEIVACNASNGVQISGVNITVAELGFYSDQLITPFVSGLNTSVVFSADSLMFPATIELIGIGAAATFDGKLYGLRGPNQIADHTLRRTMANVEASTDGDALSLGSLYGCTQQAQESSVSGTTLTVKKTDGTTTLGTKTLTLTADADPIRGVA